MPAPLRYGDGVFLGKSPAIRDIERMARKRGFRSVIDLDTEGEPGEILSPNVEASWCHTFELRHERVSMDPAFPIRTTVDRFLDTLERIPKPVYVHSLNGRRAAALITIHLGLQLRLSGEEALERARELGIDCELEHLRRFVRAELDARVRAAGEPAPERTPVPA